MSKGWPCRVGSSRLGRRFGGGYARRINVSQSASDRAVVVPGKRGSRGEPDGEILMWIARYVEQRSDERVVNKALRPRHNELLPWLR